MRDDLAVSAEPQSVAEVGANQNSFEDVDIARLRSNPRRPKYCHTESEVLRKQRLELLLDKVCTDLGQGLDCSPETLTTHSSCM